MIDLHTHSSASDGNLSPSNLISYAAEKNVSVLALCDHDTIQGIQEAAQIRSGCREGTRHWSHGHPWSRGKQR